MKVLVKISDKKLSFLNKKRLNTEYKNMLNTNVISNDELVFSDEYITKNYKILTSFFNELSKNYDVNTISFQNMEVASVIMPIVGKLKSISILNFESNEVLPYKICEKIIKCYAIKYVSAEYIPQYMFETLNKYDIIAESREEILFTSNFMELNGLSNYSSIYYKYTVYLNLPMSKEDFNDFTSFCKINRHLKVVHIDVPNKLNLEEIIYILKEYKHKNIKVIIHGDVQDPDLIEYLKRHHKEIKNKYKIILKIKYSDKFLEDNIIKETNNSILRYSAILMFTIAIGAIFMVFYDNYKSMKKVAKIQKEIETYIIAKDPEEKEKQNVSGGIKNYYISSLKTINDDAIGWLKVNNTNIDYAILQTNDNEYYLNYNIYKEKDPNGWLFLDYENKTNQIDDNTIIYGHNRFVNGVMFGTLNKTLYKNWYTNPENQIIRFDTMYGSYEYRIFSIYTIATTDDYIKTTYLDKNKMLEDFNTFKKRSIYDFGIELKNTDKILTLSTCQSDTTRLVVQAVLVKKDTSLID